MPNTSDLIKKCHGISDLFIGCKHLTINLTIFDEYSKTFTGRDSCNFFKTFPLEHTLSGSGAKSHEMAHNNPLLPVYVVYSHHTVE